MDVETILFISQLGFAEAFKFDTTQSRNGKRQNDKNNYMYT